MQRKKERQYPYCGHKLLYRISYLSNNICFDLLCTLKLLCTFLFHRPRKENRKWGKTFYSQFGIYTQLLYTVLGGVREDSSCKYLPPTFHRQVAQYSPCQRWLVGCHYLYKTFYEGQNIFLLWIWWNLMVNISQRWIFSGVDIFNLLYFQWENICYREYLTMTTRTTSKSSKSDICTVYFVYFTNHFHINPSLRDVLHEPKWMNRTPPFNLIKLIQPLPCLLTLFWAIWLFLDLGCQGCFRILIRAFSVTYVTWWKMGHNAWYQFFTPRKSGP